MGKKIDMIHRDMMSALVAYKWPGNVRELRNVIERAVILTDGRQLELHAPEIEARSQTRIVSLDEANRAHIRAALLAVEWRISGKEGAAELLGLKPTTLEAKMKKLGISRES
jgi:transcriptional regulator of acetoin/glycerol metabolism